jgi:hypothetical protein
MSYLNLECGFVESLHSTKFLIKKIEFLNSSFVIRRSSFFILHPVFLKLILLSAALQCLH